MDAQKERPQTDQQATNEALAALAAAGNTFALRQNPTLARWHDDIISTKAWTGAGWNAWNHRGSVEERTVEYLEKHEKERLDYYAWREQMIRERYADFEAAGYFDRHPEAREAL